MRDTASSPLPFIDLQAQRARISDEIDAGIARVLDHGAFIMGPEVLEVEAELAARAHVAHCLTCSSGTDALMLPLMAAEIGPGDAVFVPSFTFTSSAEVPALLGANPVFVDIDPVTFNMDAENLDLAVSAAKGAGLSPKVVMTVDLFGQPADYDRIQSVAGDHGLWILDDAAQSFGASYNGTPVGALGRVTGTSFYPSKPLGCYGDGGAVLTDDTDLFDRMKSVRVHGNGGGDGAITRIGLTARFDSIQAAVLLAKLTIFEDECARRNTIAARYSDALKDVVTTPAIASGATSVWAQYTIVSEHRDTIVETLAAEGITTALFYPKPLHTQEPYRGFVLPGGGLPVTERLAQQTVSLPLYPYLDTDAQDRIIAAVKAAVGQ
jgi:dTDP-4-amino-4,6-dideoxygalactose transaminase